MAKHSASIVINRSCGEVFDLIHNYERRLEWDTLLSKAILLEGAQTAGVGVKSLCVGKMSVGGLAFESQYITFEPGQVAAVKLTNLPPFFADFAASIRHQPITEKRSEVIYSFNFKARPAFLCWIFEPIMNWMFYKETQMRLKALKAYLENEV